MAVCPSGPLKVIPQYTVYTLTGIYSSTTMSLTDLKCDWNKTLMKQYKVILVQRVGLNAEFLSIGWDPACRSGGGCQIRTGLNSEGRVLPTSDLEENQAQSDVIPMAMWVFGPLNKTHCTAHIAYSKQDGPGIDLIVKKKKKIMIVLYQEIQWTNSNMGLWQLVNCKVILKEGLTNAEGLPLVTYNFFREIRTNKMHQMFSTINRSDEWWITLDNKVGVCDHLSDIRE